GAGLAHLDERGYVHTGRLEGLDVEADRLIQGRAVVTGRILEAVLQRLADRLLDIQIANDRLVRLLDELLKGGFPGRGAVGIHKWVKVGKYLPVHVDQVEKSERGDQMSLYGARQVGHQALVDGIRNGRLLETGDKRLEGVKGHVTGGQFYTVAHG